MDQRDAMNPILEEAPAGLLPTAELSVSRTGHTSVVYLADPDVGGLSATRTGRTPTIRERLRRPYWRFAIDTAVHWTSLSLALPAHEEALTFQARVNLTWQVHDPIAVAQAGVRDVKPIIWGLLDHHLRGISRRHSIECAGSAEEEMAEFLERKLGDVPFGLRLALVSINVHVDKAAEAYLATRVASRRARALAEDDNELDTLRRRYAGRLETEQANHAAAIERLHAEKDRQLAALTTEHELALKRQRMGFYRNALQGGNYDVLVLHLIENPDDVKAVIGLLQEDRRNEYDRAHTIIQNLLAKDLINPAEAEPIRAHAIDGLRSAFNAPAPGMTVTRERSHITTEEQTERTRVEVGLT